MPSHPRSITRIRRLRAPVHVKLSRHKSTRPCRACRSSLTDHGLSPNTHTHDGAGGWWRPRGAVGAVLDQERRGPQRGAPEVSERIVTPSAPPPTLPATNDAFKNIYSYKGAVVGVSPRLAPLTWLASCEPPTSSQGAGATAVERRGSRRRPRPGWPRGVATRGVPGWRPASRRELDGRRGNGGGMGRRRRRGGAAATPAR